MEGKDARGRVVNSLWKDVLKETVWVGEQWLDGQKGNSLLKNVLKGTMVGKSAKGRWVTHH